MTDFNLSTKPDFAEAMQRVEAWFHGRIVDRAPVRFSKHNAQYETNGGLQDSRWPTLRDRWFDTDHQIASALADIGKRTFRAETFPVYWPNLGPKIYASFFGCPLEFGEITSWSEPLISDLSDAAQLALPAFDPENLYLRKLDEMTESALERCAGKALVGITSWCPGIDCAAALMGPEDLCMSLLLEPEHTKKLIGQTFEPFPALAERYYGRLARIGQPSLGWMEIPHAGRCHTIQADFSNMISPAQFGEFCAPFIRREIEGMDRVIYHLDGKGVAKHLDFLLAEPGIHAIQWVQGVGDDEPILQWIPLIQRIQAAGKSVVVDLRPHELQPFMDQVRPEGVFLCIAAEDSIQDDLIQRIRKW
ncbi:MAG: hypothetical protein WCP06_06160 [Verrucomicrobiota bacterium]